MNSVIDLHCHTTASDGSLSPSALVERALERGIKTLAITDHDTLEGFRQARAVAAENDLTLIPGIELSCVWGGATIHIVGLNMDVDSPAMKEAEAVQLKARQERCVVIAERLSKKLNQDVSIEEVRQYAGSDIVGRPHFARYLVDKGWVPSMQVAFNKYLGAGKPGDVKTSWPELAQVVRWIVEAGGTAVMAHAHLYKMTRTKLRACMADFVEAGGTAMEVAYGQMDNNQRGQMATLAKDLELMGSCGSDFHGPNRFGLDLGVMPDFPEGIVPVWTQWQ
ncbi:MAG: PHP domain-containing protein [Pseudomonadota bacterium]|nr:PHP domain-containing protein [Pseudomonadota bacterium]MEC8523570.1 PHP domain-containing protein [Pseudomonadota bacterium]